MSMVVNLNSRYSLRVILLFTFVGLAGCRSVPKLSETKSIAAEKNAKNVAIIFTDEMSEASLKNVKNMTEMALSLNYQVKGHVGEGGIALYEVLRSVARTIDTSGTLLIYINGTGLQNGLIQLNAELRTEQPSTVNLGTMLVVLRDELRQRSKKERRPFILRRLNVIIDAGYGETILEPFAAGFAEVYSEGLGIATTYFEPINRDSTTFTDILLKEFNARRGTPVPIWKFLVDVTKEVYRKEAQIGVPRAPLFHSYPDANLLYEDLYGENVDSPSEPRKIPNYRLMDSYIRNTRCLLMEEVILLEECEKELRRRQQYPNTPKNTLPTTTSHYDQLISRRGQFGECPRKLPDNPRDHDQGGEIEATIILKSSRIGDNKDPQKFASCYQKIKQIAPGFEPWDYYPDHMGGNVDSVAVLRRIVQLSCVETVDYKSGDRTERIRKN